METLSQTRLNCPLVSAQNSQIVLSQLSKQEESTFGTFAVSGDVDALLYIAWTCEDPCMRHSADGQLLRLSGTLPRWSLILSIHQHKLTISLTLLYEPLLWEGCVAALFCHDTTVREFNWLFH